MPNELAIRVAAFLGIFMALALLERVAPRRGRVQPPARRWGTNLALSLIDTAALRATGFAAPVLAVAAAVDAGQQGIGLLNQVQGPVWLELLLALLVLDLAIWLQHLVTHKMPFLWRFHRVHHADRDVDVTTALRFHPVEIVASAAVKVGVVYLLGPSALAVLLFEVLLNAAALFTHANLRLPGALDRMLRAVLVTPDMHRVHHSVRREEHDSNYGFALSVWDRLFGTYRAAAAEAPDIMQTGLEWQDDRTMRLGWVLTLPFRR